MQVVRADHSGLIHHYQRLAAQAKRVVASRLQGLGDRQASVGGAFADRDVDWPPGRGEQ